MKRIAVLIPSLILLTACNLDHSGGLRLGPTMEPYAQNIIEEKQLLQKGETLKAYYDATISLDGSDAIVLTNQRVFRYFEGQVTSIKLKELDRIRLVNRHFLGATVLLISEKKSFKVEMGPQSEIDMLLRLIQTEASSLKQAVSIPRLARLKQRAENKL